MKEPEDSPLLATAASSSGSCQYGTTTFTTMTMPTMTTTTAGRQKLVVSRLPSSHSFGATKIRSSVSGGGGGDGDGDGVEESSCADHKTTNWQTFIHLVKGYIGPGCLSLPWAVSQLGLPLGCLCIGVVSCWTSYNCWVVVKLKRYIVLQQQQQQQQQTTTTTANALDSTDTASEAPSTVTNATSVTTYPEVGGWAHGRKFQTYILSCICIQQLAICTVFLSFIGENLQAVLQHVFKEREELRRLSTHGAVMTIVLPLVMGLSCGLPNLKAMAPVMAAGTFFLLLSFVTLGAVVGMEWADRPTTPVPFQLAQSPLAACAILYSFEGICLILPVETAMRHPEQFPKVFTLSMVATFLILAAVASLCVIAFGQVSNGSVTAFLIHRAYQDEADPSSSSSSSSSELWWLMIANTLVSISVLLTYPLQLFPALELIAPWVAGSRYRYFCGGDMDADDDDDDDSGSDEQLEKVLLDFEPLPSLPEDDTLSDTNNNNNDNDEYHSAAQLSQNQEHQYGLVDETADDNDDEDNGSNDDNNKRKVDESSKTEVPTTTSMAVLVYKKKPFLSFLSERTLPGDSIGLRAGLVLFTYLIAVVAPNVQTLISLAGAVAGSSIALLIPPVLELAWIRHIENDERSGGNGTAAGTGAAAGTVENDDWLSRSSGSEAKKTNWWMEKVKCYSLLLLGAAFALIGTYFSISDIVHLYRGGGG